MPAPFDPKKGQLWFEPYTKTLRRWDGRGWMEITAKELNDGNAYSEKPIVDSEAGGNETQ